MIFAKYNYPLPNNGSGYAFSKQEFMKLLDSVYDQGYRHGVESTIKPETITATYDNLTVTLPVDDPDHLWNKDIYNSKYEVIDKAIDEIQLLDTIADTFMYPDGAYDGFRKEVCAHCLSKKECLQSQTDIVRCPFFGNYYENYKENTK